MDPRWFSIRKAGRRTTSERPGIDSNNASDRAQSYHAGNARRAECPGKARNGAAFVPEEVRMVRVLGDHRKHRVDSPERFVQERGVLKISDTFFGAPGDERRQLVAASPDDTNTHLFPKEPFDKNSPDVAGGTGDGYEMRHMISPLFTFFLPVTFSSMLLRRPCALESIVQFNAKSVFVREIRSGSMDAFQLPAPGIFRNPHGGAGSPALKCAGVFEDKASLHPQQVPLEIDEADVGSSCLVLVRLIKVPVEHQVFDMAAAGQVAFELVDDRCPRHFLFRRYLAICRFFPFLDRVGGLGLHVNSD